MRISALILDVDGTLAETEEFHRRAFNDTFAAEGISWHWDRPTYKELPKTTGGKERMRAFIRDYGPDDAPDEADITRIHAAKTARYGKLVASGALKLRPGIAAMIEDARRRGLRVAVATTTNRPNVDALSLACFGKPAGDVFDVIAAGDEVAAKKPSPDVFLLALDRLGLSADACVALEDSRNGLLSARAAGLATIVSPGPYTDDQDFSEAGAVVACFNAVTRLDRIERAAGRQSRQAATHGC